jgi:hypothetical protein
MRRVEIEGRRFGRLVVVSHAGRRYWNVRCDCGTEKKVRSNHLTCGLTFSCGCLAKERAAVHVAGLPRTRAMRCRAAAAGRIEDGMKHCSNAECPERNPQPLSAFHANTTKSLDSRASQCRTCRQDLHLRRTFGISLKDKLAMIADQGGRCANAGCAMPLILDGPRRNAHLDHDHDTGAVRGVLCRDCNLALGYLQDSPEMISGLLRYATTYRQLRLVK